MSDDKEGTIQSLRNLAKNSINLVEKCQKPDKKGKRIRTNLRRIYENHAILCNWIRRDGCDRILNQVVVYPNQ